MRRLCVFYKNAQSYVGKPIDWIVCKQCSKALQRGTPRFSLMMYGCPRKKVSDAGQI